MKKGVSTMEVFDFKENWCDENKIISKLIKRKVANYFIAPILDVGSGLGDIAYNAFPEKEAVCIDVNKITEDEFPISKKHSRIAVDFFEYTPAKQIQTVFISHTLQFIDEDINRLNERINIINPKNLVLVLNSNDDFMGELIQWTSSHFKESNPEVRISGFPNGYVLKEKVKFKTDVECPDFERLAKQVGYLMVVDLKDKLPELKRFLKLRLGNKPKFSINQKIEIYQKDGE